MLRVPYPDLLSALEGAMQRLGFRGSRATLCARLFAETTRDGVYTHGVNRFPRFVATVHNGAVDVHAEPIRSAGFAAIERWDGQHGPGNLNAHAAMQRAMALAKEYGTGTVALANTNHWMRGGTYGWLAADAGLFAICWSNTMPNLPAWGSAQASIGNNPLVVAVPRRQGNVVLDMAMSQFSYGTLAAHHQRNAPLPVPGGFDSAGKLTQDAAAIEDTQRALPIGYWKGSGLSIVLDMMAAMLSGGLATWQLSREPDRESGQSQFFFAIDPARYSNTEEMDRIAESIIANLHCSTPINPAQPIRYPGEHTLQLREENMRLGVPVREEIWRQIRGDTY